eukprot:jgi/Mesvir1/6862/Mv09033-RA.1
MPISSEDIIKLSAAASGLYSSHLIAAPKWSKDFYLSSSEARNDTLMQWIGVGFGCNALSQLALANTPGDKTNGLKASAAGWAACAAGNLYYGLKSKTMKKDIALANTALAAALVGVSVAKLNGKL